jgi:hypothetical protein
MNENASIRSTGNLILKISSSNSGRPENKKIIKRLFVKSEFRNLKRFGTIENSKGFKYQIVNELDQI